MALYNKNKPLTIENILNDELVNGENKIIEEYNLIITTPTQTIDTTNYNFYKNSDVSVLTVATKALSYLAFHKFENDSKENICTDKNKHISTDVIAYKKGSQNSSSFTQTDSDVKIQIKIKSKRKFLLNQLDMQKTQ